MYKFNVLCFYSNSKNNKSLELENTSAVIYDAVDDKSHDSEVVVKVKANEIEPPPTRTDGRDGFDLNQCPAYVLVPTPRNNDDERDLPEIKDDLYETISSP